jgi:hypothetical protein
MIWQSFYWRRELRRSAKTLRQRITQRRWPEASTADIERVIMIGFYSVRKLAEAWKLPRELRQRKISVTEFPCIHAVRSPLFWPDVEESYDLSRGRVREQPLDFLWNQFIHSFVFVPCLNASTSGFDGVFVSSSDRRKQAVWYVEASAIIKLFEDIAAKPDRGFKFGPKKNLLIRGPW